MEDKHLIRDIFYLGIGSAAMAVYKTDELVDLFIKNNKLSMEEGKKIVDGYREKAFEAMEGLKHRRDEMIISLSEKVDMSKNEIQELFEHAMDKPRETKEKLKTKIEELAYQLSKTTKLTIEEGRKVLENFIDEFYILEESIKSKSNEILKNFQDRSEELKSNTYDFMMEIGEKTKGLREEVSLRSTKALERLRNKLDLASQDQLDDIEHRLSDLEKL